jgi:hypothetical protein
MEQGFGDIAVVQGMLNELIEKINQGEVKGFMYQIIFDNGEYLTAWSNNISYLERLGVLESTKQDMFAKLGEE